MLIDILVVFLIFFSHNLCHGYVDVERRIVNGIMASDSIPYQASIRVSVRDYARFGRGHTCGAVLVKSRTVLTAAHCCMSGESFRTPFDIHVVFGSLNRYTYTKDTRIEHVERIIVHPDYQRFDSFAHDIGILLLRRSVEFTPAIHSIQLIDHQIEDNANCRVSGWGAMYWKGSMPADLQKANVSIVNRSFCNFSYADIITEGMVCANGQNKNGNIDVCQGDSGGPLTCDGQLVGLASFGFQCGASFLHPGVFVDVFYYREWIMQNWSTASDVQKSYNALLLTTLVFFINLFYGI